MVSDYFTDRTRTRKWLLLQSECVASLRQTFWSLAKLVKYAAAIARNGEMETSPNIVHSKAKTLGGLKRGLNDLSAGMCLALKVQDFVLLSSRDGWLESRRLGQEFGCEVEFRPDGCIWFVKRELAR